MGSKFGRCGLVHEETVCRQKVGNFWVVPLGDDAVLPVRRRLFLVSVQGVKHSTTAGEFNRQNIGVMA